MATTKQRKARLKRAQQHHKACNPTMTAEQWKEAYERYNQHFRDFEVEEMVFEYAERLQKRNARNRKLAWLAVVIISALIVWWVI